MKVCNRCNKNKSLDEFHNRKLVKMGLTLYVRSVLDNNQKSGIKTTQNVIEKT